MISSHMPTCHYFSGDLNANKWHFLLIFTLTLMLTIWTSSDSTNIDSSSIKSMDVFVIKDGFQIHLK